METGTTSMAHSELRGKMVTGKLGTKKWKVVMLLNNTGATTNK